jgi:hypothetical protein
MCVGGCGGDVAIGKGASALGGNEDFIEFLPAEAGVVGNPLERTACLSKALPRDATTGLVACRLLVAIPESTASCGSYDSLTPPDASTLALFVSRYPLAAAYPVCEISPQLAAATGASCGTSTDAGWCYVDSAPAKGDCAQGVRFGARTTVPLMGAIMTLRCDPPR